MKIGCWVKKRAPTALRLWHFHNLHPSLVGSLCPADWTQLSSCTHTGWIFGFYSENLVVVVFLSISATPCCFPSACYLPLLSCCSTLVPWPLISELLCISVLSSLWVACSFFLNLNWWYLSVTYLVFQCFLVFMSAINISSRSTSNRSLGRGRPFWLQAGKKLLHLFSFVLWW